MSREKAGSIPRFHGPHSIEDRDHRHPHVGEDRRPEARKPQGTQDQDDRLDAQGEDDILLDDPQSAAGDGDGAGEARHTVVHQHHVGGLDGGVRAHPPHGDADIGAGQDGGVVDAVPHEGQLALAGGVSQQSLHPLHLVGGQKGGVVLVQPQLTGHGRGGGLAIPRQHDGALDPTRAESGDGLGGIGLDCVGHRDTPHEHAVVSREDRRPCVAVGDPRGPLAVHQLGVAHGHAVRSSILTHHRGADTVARRLLHVAGLTVIGAGRGQGAGDGVGGVLLGAGGEVEEIKLGHPLGGMDSGHRKAALGEGARLVKDHGIAGGQSLQVAGALDQDAPFGRPADAPKEGQGHRNYQSAGAGDDQKGLGTVDIASKLNLSIKTIDTHKENIKAKLHCASSAELRQMAIEWTNNS